MNLNFLVTAPLQQPASRIWRQRRGKDSLGRCGVEHREMSLKILEGRCPSNWLCWQKSFWRFYFDNTEEQEQLIQARNLLDADLNASNYADKFSLLLHCEQWTEEQDVRYFNMAEVEMKVDQGTELVKLPLQGLLEWRLSVFWGDTLCITGVYIKQKLN